MKKSEIFAQCLSPYFIETGSYFGSGIYAAINAGFENIISIELSKVHYDFCEKKFWNNSKVKLIHGDSGLILSNVIANVNDQITFWLDGHHSGSNTASGCEPVPLIKELEQIKNHHIKKHIILIDDLRLLRNKDAEWSYLDYDETDLISFLKTINKDYQISYQDTVRGEKDILICRL